MLEQSTMQDKMASGLAQLVASSPPCFLVRVRRSVVAASLALTLLDTNVECSPLAIRKTIHNTK